MSRYCRRCGIGGVLHKHHIISGTGNRKVCETEYSLIDLCPECHTFIHSSKGHEYWEKLKKALQKKYFELGYSECRVRQLMGGKLILEGDAIYGAPPEPELLRSKDHR